MPDLDCQPHWNKIDGNHIAMVFVDTSGCTGIGHYVMLANIVLFIGLVQWGSQHMTLSIALGHCSVCIGLDVDAISGGVH